MTRLTQHQYENLLNRKLKTERAAKGDLSRYWLDIGSILERYRRWHWLWPLALIKLKGAPTYHAGDYINTPRGDRETEN